MFRSYKYESIAAFQILLMVFLAFGSFFAIARFFESLFNVPIILASFGATTVVLFALRDRDTSRFYNVITGHIVSALIGIGCRYWIMPYSLDLAMISSVALAVAAMRALRSAHPPGGAVALICVVTSPDTFGSGLSLVIGVTIGAAIFYCISWAVVHLFASFGIKPWPVSEDRSDLVVYEQEQGAIPHGAETRVWRTRRN